MYRRLITVFILIVVICSCVACSNNDEQIPENAILVYCPSDNISYITPGDYPIFNAEDGEVFKWGYNVVVSKMNGNDKLTLSANRNEGLGRTSLTQCGCYYQTDELFGYEDGVYIGTEKVISEECVGLVASWMDGSAVLIFTNAGDNSYVYSARKMDETWVLDAEGKISLGSNINFIFYDWSYYPVMTSSPPKTMYLVTEEELIALSVGDYLDDKCGDFQTVTATAIETPEYWHYLRPTSAVAINDMLYIGDMFGVVEANIKTHEITYYPVDLRSQK